MTREEITLRGNQKKMKKSSESSPSFMSLPYDLVLNVLARISRTHYPVLSLVSKSLRLLLASPDLEAARFLIGKPEKYLYVCLNLMNKNPNPNPNPSWFMLSLTPNHQRKLIPIPSFPYKHLNSSSVVSVGSETYIIGGVDVDGRRSRRVFVLDCKSHQWRELPNMLLCRKEATVVVIDNKIYVIGGCCIKYYNAESYGEVYDPKTQTWEPTTLDLNINQHDIALAKVCKVDIEIDTGNVLCLPTMTRNGKLDCGSLRTQSVLGLEALSSNYLISVANPGGGRRVTVWWKTYYTKECKTEIWCAEILIEYCQDDQKIWGFVEWSENVLTFQGCETESESDDSQFLLHSALVAHDH